jgi:DNA-binding NarL/FixJ family response regulator
MSEQVRVLVVDDHEIFRAGLRTVIESQRGFSVVAEAATTREACQLLDGAHFDLIVVDLAMPGASGMSLIREIRRLKRTEPILVVTSHSEADLAAEALAAGATGFALKSDRSDALVEAVERVTRGERFISTSLPLGTIESFLRRRPHAGESIGPLAVLSPREREVCDLLVRGYSNDSIASELCISIKTVDSHRTHIFEKLQVHSLCELLRFAFRHRLIAAGVAAGGDP